MKVLPVASAKRSRAMFSHRPMFPNSSLKSRFAVKELFMSTIVVASGLPGGFSSVAALNVSFGSVLNWPANFVNKPVVVRASGSLIIPGGKYSGYLSVGISRQSDNSNLMGGGTGGFQQSGPPRAIPFRIVASVYADPFFGNILDVNAPASIFSQAGVPAALPFSGAVVGEAMDNSNPFATPIRRRSTFILFTSPISRFGVSL